MSEDIELNALIEAPTLRRSWLLLKALESLPFDRALELARSAEEFISASPCRRVAAELPGCAEPPIASDLEPQEAGCEPAPDSVQVHHIQTAPTRSRVKLTCSQRDDGLERPAAGPGTAAVAEKSGLSSNQVQGIGMGSAKPINRRVRSAETPPPAAKPPGTAVTCEDVVRYLRQQDDIVVPQGTGMFLVNNRFHLQLDELVSRANRMRLRQGKPAFALNGAASPSVHAR